MSQKWYKNFIHCAILTLSPFGGLAMIDESYESHIGKKPNYRDSKRSMVPRSLGWGGKDEWMEHRGFLAQWIYYYNGRYMSLYICQNYRLYNTNRKCELKTLNNNNVSVLAHQLLTNVPLSCKKWKWEERRGDANGNSALSTQIFWKPKLFKSK